PVEELRECLLAVLGVELVFLLDRDPGEIESLALDLLVSLRLLCLELCELVPRRLPFLAASNLVFRHLSSFHRAFEPNPSPDRTIQGLLMRLAASQKLIGLGLSRAELEVRQDAVEWPRDALEVE